jgi:hypothetical protein
MVNVRRRGFFFQEPALFGWSPARAHEDPFAHSAYNTSRKVRQWDIHFSAIQNRIEELHGGPEEILSFLCGGGKEPFPFILAIHGPLNRQVAPGFHCRHWRGHCRHCSQACRWGCVYRHDGAVLMPT